MNLQIIPKLTVKQLSPHLSHDEFKCKCSYVNCTRTMISTDLIKKFEELRKTLGRPIVVTSGYRCQRHNTDVGGVDNSDHKYGMAIDMVVTDKNEIEFARDIFKVIVYDTFIHASVE